MDTKPKKDTLDYMVLKEVKKERINAEAGKQARKPYKMQCKA